VEFRDSLSTVYHGLVLGVGSTVTGGYTFGVSVIFFIVFDPSGRRAAGFVYPNTPSASSDIVDYQVPVEQIEMKTGLALISYRN
jgi:hypothetical protein